jgi:hypothetical protein
MKDTGGPAFPTGTGVTPYNPGMTLRDYFAAKAMQAIIQANKGIYFTLPDGDLSTSAYQLADAMLKAREE